MAPPVGNFNYPVPYRIGVGRVRELPGACADERIRRPLVVTDPGVRALPWFAGVLASLEVAGLEAAVFSDVHPNPTGRDVDLGIEMFLAGKHDGVVLIGGGSAMDAGKCIALVANNPGSVFDYEDVGDNWKRADPSRIAPIIAVPTTAGTGSEVGRASVIVDESDHAKKIIFHAKMQPGLVIADPELTFGLPATLTAATGMDALAHCFEAYCAPAYHPMADGIALEGLRIIDENLRTVFADGTDATARTNMLIASSMGATAFQKGLGLVHALSHPLGGATGIHHGTANAIFMPYVMVYNREVIADRMELMARYLALPKSGFDGVMEWVLGLREHLGMPHTLEVVDGFDEAMAKRLAPLAVNDPTMASNPKSADAAACERVFMAALRGDLG